jgi:hypothetical protein
MIISHRYKFIFIKTHKTAGSSMEMALGPLCGPDDIIAPMESNLGTDIPRNYHATSMLGRAYAKSRLFRKCINRHSPMLGGWYYEHMPAVRVRELVGEDIWNSYHKFCFERNPWAKVVSYYHWKKLGQHRKLPPFREYVMEKTNRLPLDARLYFEGDVCLMDEVLDFDNFEVSFLSLCRRLGIPFDGNMPKEKTHINRQPIDHRSYYDEETSARVAECFHREIGLLGYQFDPDVHLSPAILRRA